MTSDEHGEAIGELQLQLALANDHLEALELTVYRQQKQLDLLQDQLREMHRRLVGAGLDEAAGPGPTRDPREDIPPHY